MSGLYPIVSIILAILIPTFFREHIGLFSILLYPLWAWASYEWIDYDASKTGPLYFMRRSDGMGWFFWVLLPMGLSAIVFAIEYLGQIVETGKGSYSLIFVLSLYPMYKLYSHIRKSSYKKKMDVVARSEGSKFELPKSDISQYKEPRVSKKKFDEFIIWAKSKGSGKDKEQLSEIIKKDLVISSNGELVFDFLGFYETSGMVNSSDYDFEFSVDKIDTQVFEEEIDIEETMEDLVGALHSPEVYPIYIYEDLAGENMDGSLEYDENEPPTSTKYYLSIDKSEYIPKSENIESEFKVDGHFEFRPIGYKLLPMEFPISLWINSEKFYFNKDEKEHLITLLIASYKPSLLKKILKELENENTNNKKEK